MPIYQAIRVSVVPKWNAISIRQASSQHRARRWIVAACFLTLIFWYRAAFGRILTVYCDRDHKSPAAFKLLQFDSGSFYLYIFLFFTLSVCHLCFNRSRRNVLEISYNSIRFSNLVVSRIVTIERMWQVILCSESIGRSRPSNGYPHCSNRFIIVSLTFAPSCDGPQITKLQYLPPIASLQRPINSQERTFDVYPLC